MDDKPEDPGETRTGRPTSLVERAAKKIVVDHARPLPGNATPAAGAALPLGDGPADVAEDIAAKSVPAQAVEKALRGAALGDHPRLGGAAEPAPGAQRRKSKVVNIDVAGLLSRNILTLQTKRNKTVEEFRLIKRKVLSRRWVHGDAHSNTIMITSALPAEGKTTIAVNLAMSIAAEKDLRVLLIDADFIKPDALRRLGITAGKGLIDVIEDPRLDIADVMLGTNIENLSLIPAGQLHERCTELLASARMTEIIAELATRYEDRILIFDSPPVLATTESVTLASHMGQIVFVVQAGQTRRQLVTSALELLGNRQNVGLVLNRATPGFGSTEFGSYYGSYYGAYFGKEEREAEPN